LVGLYEAIRPGIKGAASSIDEGLKMAKEIGNRVGDIKLPDR